MIRHTSRIAIWLVALFLATNVAFALLTNVSSEVTNSDEIVFRTVLNIRKPEGPLSYDQEIELIRAVQKLVLEKAPLGPPIPEYSEREPENLFAQNSGLCYDRSRTYDKVFSWLGFKSRHIFILYPEHPITGKPLSIWRALITQGINSHAVTEVKTSRGWLVVDSNSAWISILADGVPINVDHIYERARQFSNIPAYFARPFWAIRGMYSRGGQFFYPYIPYPELNWADFTLWALANWGNHSD